MGKLSPRHLLLLLTLLFALRLHADDHDYDLNFYVENDFSKMSFWGSDRSYSNGLRFSFLYANDELPSWARNSILDGHGHDRWSPFNFGLSLGQQIYTPADLSRSDLIVDDQPYAGYLYGGGLFHVQKGETLHSIELDLGVIGPPSLAGITQTTYHRAFGMREPRGWDNQLKTEPTVALFYQQKRKLFKIVLGEKIADVMPYFGGAFGNVYIYGGLGLALRVGIGLADDFGSSTLAPVGVEPYIESRGLNENYNPRRRFFEGFFFMAGESRFIARNIFLDGNTFESSHHVDKIPYVYDLEMGLVVRTGSLRLMWRQVMRSREFTLEPSIHCFASLGISYSYRFG